MRIILLTGQGLEHIYVANRLAAYVPLNGVVVDQGRYFDTIIRVNKSFRKYTLYELASRTKAALARLLWRDGYIGKQSMVRTFGPENCREFSRPNLLRHINGINTQDGLQVISALKPDLLLIYGTRLVGSRVLSLARSIALNMHTGLAPCYRGADCAFWPIYNQELHMIGATVHECTNVIDGGRIFGRARAILHPDDDVFSVFARSVIAGADLYVSVVRDSLACKLNGTEQDLSLGREYRAVMRDIAAERRVRKLIKEGMIRRYVDKHQSKHSSLVP